MPSKAPGIKSSPVIGKSSPPAKPKKIKPPYGDLKEDPIRGPEPLPKAKKPMKFTDFKIGMTFYTASGEWEVVDMGSKLVVAINKKHGPNCLFPETYWTLFFEYDWQGCMIKPYKPFEAKA